MTLAGFSARGGGAQRRGQRLGQEERRLDVEVHHLVPAAFRKLVEIRAPRRAGIVDEDIQLRFALPDLGRQHLDAGHGGNIDRQRDAFAAIFRRQFLGGRLARSGLARGDVDLRRALAEKAGRDHLADAARSPGHQRDAALQRKQILEHAPPWLLPMVLGEASSMSQGKPLSSSRCRKHRAKPETQRVRGDDQVAYAASMRRKPFHIAVAAPEVSTGRMRAS